MIIVSGADKTNCLAQINHLNYSQKHTIPYNFFVSTNLCNPFFTKCYAILDCFNKGYDKVLWIDDDVFFIDLTWECRQIFSKYQEDIIVTQGRTNKKSGTTLFNNGIMFIRNTKSTQELFQKIPNTSWQEIKENWNNNWGPCEGNDQPRMIYLIQTQFPKKIKILEYPGFNAHEITFKQRKNFLSTKPPFVHITGTNKKGKIKRFTEVTGIPLP